VNVYDTILDAIGRTPLIRLQRVTRGTRTPVYGKAEHLNPGASVKDRIGLAMIEAAERDGSLRPGGVVVEGTSGNTGVGLALAAAVKGYRCIFTIPDKMSVEKVRLLRGLGAEVVVVPTAVPPDHPDNYLNKARSIVESTPGAILANQHFNPANPEAHYRTTGPEIWEQTGGKITHFVASAGTGGTVSGIARYLKEQNPAVRIICPDPVGSIYREYGERHTKGEGGPYKVEGIGGDKIPTSLHFDLVDEWITVSDADAFQMARRCTREEGLFIGGSAGMNVFAAIEVASRVDDPDAYVVTVLCDTGERYLSKLFDDRWMRENQLLPDERTTAEGLLAERPAGLPPLVSIAPGGTVRQALNLMSTYGVTEVPVLDGADCVGSLSEGTLQARALENPHLVERSVGDVMGPPYPVVDAQLPLERLTAMLTRESPAVLVRQGGKLGGIATRYDVLRHVAGIR
jgi:cystathionine beta-synthase